MGRIFNEFETKMHEYSKKYSRSEKFLNDELKNEFKKQYNKLIEQFLCLSKKDQNKFFDKYEKEKTFVQLKTKLNKDLHNGVDEEFVKKYIEKLKSIRLNFLIISFLVDMVEIYNNPNYDEKSSNDFLNRFLGLTEDEQNCLLGVLGFEGESILKLESKNENSFLKLPEGTKRSICFDENKFKSPKVEQIEKEIKQKEKEIEQKEKEIEQKEIEFAEIEQEDEFKRREEEVSQLKEEVSQLKEDITDKIEEKKCILFNLASLSFLVKLKTKINKDNEKATKVEINKHALIDFGGLILAVGIGLLVFGIISAFLFSPIAWGLCLGLGTVFSTAGGFSIYEATEKNKSLNELSKKENVQDLHEKLNGIEEEDINENPNKSKKLNAGMSEVPLLANANVSQNQDKKYK